MTRAQAEKKIAACTTLEELEALSTKFSAGTNYHVWNKLRAKRERLEARS